ncbi:hypothetical protein GH714_015817 [Hevea brasiliensis]|uniref:Uncharacterized protein n=1 Tax=Hevea brasiliensis TaxID=3981 RepID=A0A6A6LH59_HEVBR|nr:hypothetical protein GH714_015817 [Hevea brasiliensis]
MGESIKSQKTTDGYHITAADHHHNMLSSVIGDEGLARQSKIHSYGKSFDAFGAYLLPEEAERLKEHENVISVFPNTNRKLHTTRSWDFLGMPMSVKRNIQRESDTIVGVIDTGIYIDAPSFNDKGYGPPPSKWKGVCQKGSNFTGCNNKVIGARVYNLGEVAISEPSPADTIGHGSHTASTVAGVPVKGASLYGLGRGTARGGVPSARIAMYKVCSFESCSDLNLLAAFDDAIEDGVEIISVSIGGGASSYFMDPIAIGAYHAMKKGILTSCSAGNDGPFLRSIENTAPWILTVGAGSMDRQFSAPVITADGMKIFGLSINTFTPKSKTYPLISGSKATNFISIVLFQNDQGMNGRSCSADVLDKDKVKGKILFCKGGDPDDVDELGGAGTILLGDSDTAFTFASPVTILTTDQGQKMDKYINSTKNPQGVILKSISVKIDAPSVASFSSRGPDPICSTLLKPDLIAPGIDILAAYTKLVSVTGTRRDNRFVPYNIISGTSMSCPHASAAAAYVKTFHPNWSPSAIKSALMTTASEIKIKHKRAEWQYGSGQIDPTKALDPGLVYDMSERDYVRFLCKQGYSGSALSTLTGEKINCSSIHSSKGNSHDALNYPSMHIFVENSNDTISAVFHRIVTNVGSANSTYKATVKAPNGFKITCTPDTLVFNKVNEKKSFRVTVQGPSPFDPDNTTVILSGSLEWSDSEHKVRIPIVIASDRYGEL